MTWDEFISLLKTADTPEEINSRREEIANFIPEIRIMFDFDQKNYAHPYDLWMHCVHTVLNLPRDIDDDMLYLAKDYSMISENQNVNVMEQSQRIPICTTMDIQRKEQKS